MLILVNSCLVLFLILIGFQDFKQRAISWFLIPLSFGALFFNATYSISTDDLMKNFLLNISFVSIQLTLLTLYMSIKNKRIINILKDHLGLGDLLFFVVLCIAFSPINFIVFFIVSMIATLIGCIIYASVFSIKVLNEIPLAGAMSSILLVLLVINKTATHLNLYDDTHLLNLINNV